MNRFAALLAITFAATATTGPAAAKTLTYCLHGNPEGFDPALHLTEATYDASSRQIYDRLVSVDPMTMALEPALAESWSVSEDGLTYIFRLRGGVAFHGNATFTPGRTLNADDVVFSFNRQLVADHPFHAYVVNAGWEASDGLAMPSLVADVARVDDLTVRFVLTRPDASFVARLAMDFASILSEEYASALLAAGTPEELDLAPVGTGPFSLVSRAAGQDVRFAAHDGYWAGRPAIDDLVFLVAPDPARRFELLRGGECHAMARPNPADLADMAADPEIDLLSAPGFAATYLALDTRRAPFDNANVRRALALAIDREAIVGDVFRGTATVAQGFVPIFGDSMPIALQHDPQAARNLLADEAVEGLSLRILISSEPGDGPSHALIAERIAGDLAAIGVQVEIEVVTPDGFRSSARAPERGSAVVFTWSGEVADPDSFLAPLFSCDGVGLTNLAQWCHDGFDQAIQAASSEPNAVGREAFHQEAQILLNDQVPMVPLAQTMIVQPVRRGVENWVVDPLGRAFMGGLDLGAQF